MIKGDPMVFAVESTISKTYAQNSLMALGSFSIHVAGKSYGVLDPTATMLACSYDSVARRIEKCGTHEAFFEAADALHIAMQYIYTFYQESEEISLLSFDSKRFQSAVENNELIMAPDGDSAFDDGSHILQFDVGENVRILAFKNESNPKLMMESLAEIILDKGVFYSTLSNWLQAFSHERKARLSSEPGV